MISSPSSLSSYPDSVTSLRNVDTGGATVQSLKPSRTPVARGLALPMTPGEILAIWKAEFDRAYEEGIAMLATL